MSRPFDVIVVGAGSAGATLAALLSRADGRRVCLVEAGADYPSSATPDAIRGANFHMALRSGMHHWTSLMARYTDAQEPNLYIAGKGVGGTSAINGQGAVRGLPADYDGWARRGCVGWSWDEVLPAFVRLERDLDFGNHAHHGASGPIPVGREPRARWGLVSRALEEAAVAGGHPVREDANAPADGGGVSPIPWNRRDGARVSTNDAYLESARGRANLTIRSNVTVDRLALAGRRVTGVVVRTSDGEETIEGGEVILCAGVFHSPAILLRSGIGPAAQLRALGIDVVADRAGVGRGLQDHPMVWLTFALAPSARAASTDVLPSSCLLRMAVESPGAGLAPIEVMPLERTPMDVDSGGFMISLMGASSRGNLRLASRNPHDEPVVALGMLSSEGDARALRQATRGAQRLVDHPALKGLMESGLRLAPGEALADADDRTLDQWLARNCMPHFHASGTCRMGSPEDPEAVVDPAARVVGVEGVRVVDASIIPVLPEAPTHLTTVMMAEHVWRRHFV